MSLNIRLSCMQEWLRNWNCHKLWYCVFEQTFVYCMYFHILNVLVWGCFRKFFEWEKKCSTPTDPWIFYYIYYQIGSCKQPTPGRTKLFATHPSWGTFLEQPLQIGINFDYWVFQKYRILFKNVLQLNCN